MNWREAINDQLVAFVPGGYDRTGPIATEPTALAALAICAAGRGDDAAKALTWLATRQNADGSFGPTEHLAAPCWPTSLVIQAALSASGNGSKDCGGFACPVGNALRDIPLPSAGVNAMSAIAWLLEAKGGAMERTEPGGHDPTLVGWPWVIGTHSWIEPTALAVMALRAAGQGDHPRTREAVRLLNDRLLPGGGCNYGNTVVLGQALLPHLQPTAIALIALHNEPGIEAIGDGRIARSLDYLRAGLGNSTATASLSYGLMALAKYQQLPHYAEQWLASAYQRTIKRGASAYKLALLSLAAGHLAATSTEATQ